MHRLRAPGGCPWDAKQTHESLLTNLIEESYEVVDAIRSGDLEHMREELGDLLLQVVFHSELASEAGNFNLDEVARGISEKLIRRHPHVFASSDASTTDAVLNQWDAIKRAEKGDEEKPYLHGVGKGLPALQRAAKLQKKAAKVGFDWPDQAGVVAKIHEELQEVEDCLNSNSEKADEELGDLLFSVVNLIRKRGSNPEILMAAANGKFEDRFAIMESRLREQKQVLDEASLDEMESAWQQTKRN